MSANNQIATLATDFGRASRAVASALFDVYQDEGDKFADEWRANAVVTSGKHGRLYPASISAEMKLGFGVAVEVGPEIGKDQGGMGEGFELGGPNQPPHLDGLRASGPAEQRLAASASAAIVALI